MASYSPLESTGSLEKERMQHSIEDGSELSEEELLLGYQQAPWRREGSCSWSSWIRRHRLGILFHVMLVTLNVLLSIAYVRTRTCEFRTGSDHRKISHALDRVIKPEERHFELLPIYKHGDQLNSEKPGNFNGPPRPELEAEWDEIMRHTEVRVSEEELGQFAEDDSIIKLGDDSGYFVTVSAFHGLHCVRRIRQYMYPETYYPDLTDHEKLFLRMHTEHCLDWLRQYVQCHADPTLIPIHWMTGISTPVSKDRGFHQCVAWEPIMEWMKDHSFNSSEPGMLVHPIFGAPGILNSTGPSIGLTEGGPGGLLHADGHFDSGYPDQG